ncbi:hypothetical protein ILUMI_27034 [Ignelater luminosus]|uniref:Uncharacterized protein n=1 Tax=Ignelater luminosus TaxID=2038154 RepID=A0A8K0C7A9_IGNLU|nr:hypothetical protein ILUMI_27034 [Ignelater luminosus]
MEDPFERYVLLQLYLINNNQSEQNCLKFVSHLQGLYMVKNGIIDFTRFPPHVPRGQYMIQIILSDGNAFVAELQIEYIIEGIIKKWEKS